MGVAVLHPQDCLKKSQPPNMKLAKPKPKHARSHPKRAHSTRPEPATHTKPQANNLVMGHVKLLKRGEQLTQTTSSQQPNTVNKQFRQSQPVTEKTGSLYAGASMVVASPPPSSVPLPIFVTKKFAANWLLASYVMGFTEYFAEAFSYQIRLASYVVGFTEYFAKAFSYQIRPTVVYSQQKALDMKCCCYSIGTWRTLDLVFRKNILIHQHAPSFPFSRCFDNLADQSECLIIIAADVGQRRIFNLVGIMLRYYVLAFANI
ncbi:hypothetical protein RIF29_12406 [Crotalaria pallida]|uniref:Uncharacterized protein n=1 Tax=Crotalaria pallida TaxID=3830 RepID=A0AAN9P105_CROPI